MIPDCTSGEGAAEQIQRRLWLELHDRQARYSLEVADVQRGNVVAEMQRCDADQQIFERDHQPDPFRLGVNLRRDLTYLFCKWFNRNSRENSV